METIRKLNYYNAAAILEKVTSGNGSVDIFLWNRMIITGRVKSFDAYMNLKLVDIEVKSPIEGVPSVSHYLTM